MRLDHWLASVAGIPPGQLAGKIRELASVWYTKGVTIITPPCRLDARSRQTTSTHEIKSYDPANTPDDL